MSSFNLMEKLQLQKQIQDLEEQVKNLNEKLTIEREEFKDIYKRNNNNLSNSSNYVDIECFVETQYIHNLKTQINNLINQNNILKNRNRELIEENESLKKEKKI